MSSNFDDTKIDMDDLLTSLNNSLSSAQQSLLGGSGLSANMMLDSAELEVKVSIEERSENGRMKVRPISISDITNKSINPAMVSTIKVKFVGVISDEQQGAFESVTENTHFLVPDITGMTLRKAEVHLKELKWNYEVHTVTDKEIVEAGRKTFGKVIRQKPTAGTTCGSKEEIIHLWVNLGKTPVTVISGIGDKLSASLAKMGIRSVGQLSHANTEELSKFLKMNTKRTEDFIERAAKISTLTNLGLHDNIVELLTKGAGIQSVEELAKANPDQLLKICRSSEVSNRVPSRTRIDLNERTVKSWVQIAQKSLTTNK